jgi:hypothetical protein
VESRSSASADAPDAVVVVSAPDGDAPLTVALSGERVTVGRLPDTNDIALQPDPERLVTRTAHCTLERAGTRWFVVDGGGVNGTFIRRGREFHRVEGRTPLADGDVIAVLAAADRSSERRFFELAFRVERDSEATRAAGVGPDAAAGACLRYDPGAARLLLVHEGEEHEIPLRAQAHRLVAYMADRNASAAGSPALCTHDELINAVWGDEPFHSREELAKLVWELRRKLHAFGAEGLVENAPRLGYRIRTCPDR